MIAGFSAINGHISGQCRVVGSGGLLAAPQVAAQATREMGVTPDLCLHFQGQHFNGHPQSTCTAVGGIAACIKPTLAPPPPPLPPQPRLASTLPLPQSVPHVPPAAAPKPGQGGFKKVCRTEEASPCPFPGLAAGVLHMRVKEGSKIRNLMGFAMARMQGPTGSGTETATRLCGGTGSSAASAGSAVSAAGSAAGLRQVVFSGSGRAVTKTITCAEIMKRKLGGLHQLTKLCYKGVREVWESQEPAAAAAAAAGGTGAGGSVGGGGTSSEMTVHRTVPSISILLSKDPLDPREPGYQPPETLSALWGEREEQGGAPSQAATKRAMLLEPLAQAGQPAAKRLCVGAAVPLCCPAD